TQREDSRDVITVLNQILHKQMVSDHEQKRQGRRVEWNGEKRSRKSGRRELRKLSPQQRPSDHERSRTSLRGNGFIDRGLGAPYETETLRDHPPEKVSVLSAAAEFLPECILVVIEDCSTEKDIPGSRVRPVKHFTCFVRWPVMKSTAYDPLGRGHMIERQHRTQDTVRPELNARGVEPQQPARLWHLVVINECDELSLGVSDGLVSRQGNILLRLHVIAHRR